MPTAAKRWRGRNAELTDEAIFLTGETLTKTGELLKAIEEKGSLDPVTTTVTIATIGINLATILRTLERIGIEKEVGEGIDCT